MGDSLKLVTISSTDHHQVMAAGLWHLFTTKHRLDFEFQWGERSVGVHQLMVDVFLSPEKVIQHCSGDAILHSSANPVQAIWMQHDTSIANPANQQDSSCTDPTDKVWMSHGSVCTNDSSSANQGDQRDSGISNPAWIQQESTITNSTIQHEPSSSTPADRLWDQHGSSSIINPADKVWIQDSSATDKAWIQHDSSITGNVNEKMFIQEISANTDADEKLVHQSVSGSNLPDNNQSSSLDSLVEFLYRGTVTLPENQLDLLLEVALQLDFKLLVDAIDSAKKTGQPEIDAPEVVNCTRNASYMSTHQRRKGNPVKITDDIGESSQGSRPDCEEELLSSSPSSTPSSPEPAKKRTRFGISEPRRAASSRISDRKLRLAKSRTEEPQLLNTDPNSVDLVPVDRPPESEIEASIASDETEESSTRSTRKRKTNNHSESRAAAGIKSSRAGISRGSRRTNAEHCRRWIGRQEILKCGHCEFETRRKGLFDLHLAKHDPSVTVYKCAKCSKTFLDLEASQRHDQAVHTGEPERYQCTMCEFSTPNKRSHRTHVRAVHRDEWRQRRAEARATNLHRCDQCDFSALHACKLKLHMLMKHSEGQEKPFKCHEEQCNYSSIRKSDLEKHINGAHLRLRPFVCEMCGQACAHQTALKQHLRTHTGEKPYVCGQCGQAYGDPSSFKQHLKRHVSDEKPYVCHLCGHRCRRRDNLRVHLKGVHKTTLELVSDILHS